MPPSSASRPPADEGSWLAGRDDVELQGNQPWLLDDRDQYWAVIAGGIDVFAVRVDGAGQPRARHHVAHVGPGQFISGRPVSPGALGADGMGLLAVPSEMATIVPLSRAEVSVLLADPEERLLAVLALSEWLSLIHI